MPFYRNRHAVLAEYAQNGQKRKGGQIIILGAIIGDIIGSRFEFDRGSKSKEFELFTSECEFTDDTVMTIAVAEAF